MLTHAYDNSHTRNYWHKYDALQFTMHVLHLRSHFWFDSSKVSGFFDLVLASLSLKLPPNSMPNLITPSGSLPSLHGTRTINYPKRKSTEWVIRTLGFKSQFSKWSVKWYYAHVLMFLTTLQFSCLWNKAQTKSIVLSRYCIRESPGNYFKTDSQT